MQSAAPNSFGAFQKEWKDPFPSGAGQSSSVFNSFGNRSGKPTSQDPFRSFKSSGNGFYRNQRNNVAMDIASSNDDARGRGRVAYHRGRGRANYQDSRFHSSEPNRWTNQQQPMEEVSWPFSCYGLEYQPNTVDGDISFEEWRAEAYAAALQGVGLNEIVQRERALAAEYRNRQPKLHSKTDNVIPNTPSSPFGTTTTPFGPSSNPNPFQSNSFVSNRNSQGGMSVFSVIPSTNSGYSNNVFQDFPRHNENLGKFSSDETNSNPSNLEWKPSDIDALSNRVEDKTITTTTTTTGGQESNNAEQAINYSLQDMEQFRAVQFQLGNVPEMAPCKEVV